MSRREQRSNGGSGGRTRPPRRRRRLGWLWGLIAVLVVAGAGTAAVWVTFEDQVRQVMGWELPNDYEGTGNGEPVTFVITEGEIGSDIATNLVDAGVTMTYDAFYDLLLLENPTFSPGAYSLQKEMSAESALAALQDPANRVTAKVTLREGITVKTMFAEMSEATGVPVAEYEAAAADVAAFGLPAGVTSLEGYLFPATYTFDPGLSAHDQIALLVNTMFQRLDTLGVAPEDRHRVVTIASLIQREAGVDEDFYKVSRVIQNRLDRGMPLQFDSTSAYGWVQTYGPRDESTVWTSDEERADPNPWNTYAHTGLPVGPIAAPGDLALDAALNPVAGDWLYFVVVDHASGLSEFTTNSADHERAAEKGRQWCRDNPDYNC